MEDRSELARLSLDPSVLERFQSPAQRAERSKKGAGDLLRELRDGIYNKLQHPSQNLTIELQTRPFLMKGTSAERSARVAIGLPRGKEEGLVELTFTGVLLGESLGRPSDTWRLELMGKGFWGTVEKLVRQFPYDEGEMSRVEPDGRTWEELYKVFSFIGGEIKRQRIMTTETQVEKDLKEIAADLKSFAARPDLVVSMDSIPKGFQEYVFKRYYMQDRLGQEDSVSFARALIPGTGSLFRQIFPMRTSREIEEAAENPDFEGVRQELADVGYGLVVVKDVRGVPKEALLVGLGPQHPRDLLTPRKPVMLSLISLREGIVTGLTDGVKGTFLGDSQIGITDHVRQTADWIKAIAENPKRPNRDLVYPGTKWEYTVEGKGDLTVKLTPEGRERLRQEAKSLREESM